MASVKFSAIVSDVRGKIGGVVFARSANGAYIRGFKMPTNKNTPSQQYWKGNLQAYAQKWRSLTDEDRQAWIDYAPQVPYRNRIGDQCTYTGFQLYLKTNLVLEAAAIDE